MFVKCASCGYLTPDGSPLCKRCGAVVGSADAAPTVPEAVAPEPLEPAPAVEPTADAAWPPSSMPPPDPASAAPGWSSAPPKPPATPPPVPSMFPEPSARPPRRAVPTWSIVSAALAVVAIAVVLALAFGGGSGSGSRGAATPATKDGGARADADTVDPQLHPSDLGNGWVPVRIEPLTAEDLDPSDDCWPALSTEPRATFGIGEQFSYRLKSDGTEFGHLAENVTEYPSAASTRVVLGNRNDPLFEPCVDADDRSYLTGDTDTTDVTSTPLVRTIITGATVYHHQLNYTYRGTPSAMEFWSVFFGAGRFKFTLYLSGNLDVGTVDNIINAAIRRLQTAANS